jgi:hypothetical protein
MMRALRRGCLIEQTGHPAPWFPGDDSHSRQCNYCIMRELDNAPLVVVSRRHMSLNGNRPIRAIQFTSGDACAVACRHIATVQAKTSTRIFFSS